MFRHIVLALTLLAGLVACKKNDKGVDKVDNPLTVERLHASPSLNGKAPKGLKFSPDGQHLTYLKSKEDNKRVLELWAFDLSLKEHKKLVDSAEILSGKKEELSDEEKARRERRRIEATGIVDYFWNEQGTQLMFSLSGDLYIYDIAGRKSKRITNTEAYELDPQFSPQGRYVSFIRDQDIFIVNVTTDKERQLTFDGEGLIKNGMADFVTQEEIRRYTGYWWSEDESYMAFTQVDESPVSEEVRVEILADGVDVKTQRYPITGTANTKVKLGILPVSRPRKITWLDLGIDENIYIPRVQWHPDKLVVFYQVQSRDQKSLRLISYEPKTKKQYQLLEESSNTWINILGEAHFLENKNQFVWSSERDGFHHLYLYSDQGELLKKLTSGEWAVSHYSGFRAKTDEIYFTGKKKTPLETQLYRVNVSGEPKVSQVSTREGVHWVTMSEDSEFYTDSFSNTTIPVQTSLHTADGQRLIWIEKNELNEDHPLFKYRKNFTDIEFDSFTNSSGDQIYLKIVKPPGFNPSYKYPLIVSVYGGPGPQLVKKSWGWNWSLWHQLLAQQGFVVITADNRGSSGRGKAFEEAIYGQLANVEVEDQKEATEYVLKKGFVDKERIAVTGHSYGGYMTLMMMAKHPEIFSIGVAVAPVTDFSLYDTHYTERYLGTPQGNPDGYKLSNVISIADQIRGKLLVIHGMADDNALFKNSTMLFKKLQDAKIPFEMMTYPGGKHGLWGEATQVHSYNTSLEFLLRNANL